MHDPHRHYMIYLTEAQITQFTIKRNISDQGVVTVFGRQRCQNSVSSEDNNFRQNSVSSEESDVSQNSVSSEDSDFRQNSVSSEDNDVRTALRRRQKLDAAAVHDERAQNFSVVQGEGRSKVVDYSTVVRVVFIRRPALLVRA